jgi:rubrerythrin
MLRSFFGRILDSLREYLNPDKQKDLLEILSQEYIEKSENVLKLTDYAATMVYPQFRDKLLRIASEEQAYIHRLAEHIAALGGEVPQTNFSPRPGKNAWERLLTALEKKKRHISDRIDRLVQLQRIDPKFAEELRRMRQEEEIHHREIQAMMMRSDPQAGRNSKTSVS